MTSISKIAVVATGLAMAASLTLSVAPAAAQSNADLQAQITSLLATIQSLQAQLNGSQTTTTSGSSVSFTRDLTIGSKGADVTALQTWLIGKGYTVAAGATGYFGAQTKAALAAYQSAKGITPASGYFGPLTRASISAMGGSTTTTTTTTTTGSTALSGTEATLSNYQFNGGVGTMHEGDTNVALANAKFDVQNGDINVQRVDLELQASNTSYDTHPWKYITSITAWDGSTKLGTVDTSNSSAWNDNLDDANHAGTADVYKISITGLNDVVKAGATNHQISFTANVNSTLDSSSQQHQSFYVDIPDQGIRAVDAVGIQQYVGGTSDTITLSFNSADNGKITVSEDSSDPATGIIVVNSSNVTQSVPVLAFNLRNTNNGATQIDDLLIDVATSSYATTTSIINNATLVVGGQSYSGTISNTGGTNYPSSIYFRNVNFTVPGNSSVVGTLKVDLASQSNYSGLSSPTLTFSLPAEGVTAEGASSGDTITVASGNLSGTATGHAQTLATSGIAVVANSASVVSSPAASGVSAYNTYTIKFDVSAVQNDAFVPTTASTTASTTTGVIFALAGSSFTGSTTASLSSTADTNTAGYYKVPAGSTRTFTLTVVLKPGTGQSGLYEVDLSSVYFNTTGAAPTQHYTIDSTNSGFKTNPTYSAN